MMFFNRIHSGRDTLKFLARFLFALLAFALSEAQAWGHAFIVPNAQGQFNPRGGMVANKVGPCGDVAGTTTPLPRDANPTMVKPGDTVTFKWEEQIKHPGYFIISLSQANDQNFTPFAGKAMIPEDPNVPAGGFYTTTLTIPNQTCNTCTIQLIQVMTENPAAPTNYYSCSDIVITNVIPNPTGTPAPVTSPSPVSSPVTGPPTVAPCH